jgi:hypothetical protein
MVTVKSQLNPIQEQLIQSWLTVPQKTRIELYSKFADDLLDKLSALSPVFASEINFKISQNPRPRSSGTPSVRLSDVQNYLLDFQVRAKELMNHLTHHLADYPQALVQIMTHETTQQKIIAQAPAAHAEYLDAGALVELSRILNSLRGVSIQSIRSNDEGDLEISFSLSESVNFPSIH